MRIVNRSRRSCLSEHAAVCKSLLRQARGLMFSRHHDLIFELADDRLVPLHMIFVFHPIDVIYVGSNQRVVELVEQFKPWSYHSPKMNAKWVLELTAGAVGRSGTKTGDRIEFR